MNYRIKNIVELVLEDFYLSDKTSSKTHKELENWLYLELLEYSKNTYYYTHELSIKALELLESLDIVDLEFIHKIVLKEYNKIEFDIEQFKTDIRII